MSWERALGTRVAFPPGGATQSPTHLYQAPDIGYVWGAVAHGLIFLHLQERRASRHVRAAHAPRTAASADSTVWSPALRTACRSRPLFRTGESKHHRLWLWVTNSSASRGPEAPFPAGELREHPPAPRPSLKAAAGRAKGTSLARSWLRPSAPYTAGEPPPPVTAASEGRTSGREGTGTEEPHPR